MSPRSLSAALTFHPLFSPIFLNVYKIHRLDISLSSKANMLKPDFIVSSPKPPLLPTFSRKQQKCQRPQFLRSILYQCPLSIHCPLCLHPPSKSFTKPSFSV